MTPETVLMVGQKSLQLTAMLASPLLLSALAVGLLIGMFQAATQINEMTLSFIPKLITLAVALAAAGSWMLRLIMDFTRQLISNIPYLISGG
ncbi:MAG: flagellar biosynthesis protein FliQ [Gammaproteobacteria bacterium]|nr:flagellar biosynthesis protein FliQ [Gammaproteobacteria bacterium]NNF60046.1 flagellar biosynthesis protein FliQ [Gammaproteobacteria bacterium]NNM19977.1 flagellar biosynthesis protein FliQ [Gammaproteobacteria bacterium]